MGIANRSKLVVDDISTVYKIREGVYRRKAEIIKAPMVREIVHVVFGAGTHPPMEIHVSRTGIVARTFDAASGTYHPIRLFLLSASSASYWAPSA